MAQLLLVEDDAEVRSRLVRALGERGHAVASAPTGMDGIRRAVSARPDLVILDLGLPDLDGGEVLRMLRAVSSVPVIVATARDDEREIERILNAGADDYLVKPFGAGQLDARVRAVLRRAEDPGAAAREVRVGGLRMNAAAREAALDGRPLELSPKEFDLLFYLASRPGQVVSKRELLTEVWHVPLGGANKTIDVHVAWLRRKLGESASRPRYLRSVRGSGIKIVDPS
ncbi:MULTISPECIES: response regulator transcription factor [Actinomadura]|uniref:Response regulator transcription factor n=1 Tax=Actinomadura montaniterrae TaxID=1803903 RepID=A0A6L3VMB9_9ACTN|nr:response regulator transcription factor [Actinomadura montaniterrae]KAB2362825.1 response regulator transcription factor [Actinomadura montaniterrae]HEU5023666.1 response regulator transcription factor [Spirillospora sp.]